MTVRAEFTAPVLLPGAVTYGLRTGASSRAAPATAFT
ncbi:hypothetical protein ACVW19_003869 [Streptomyces sp. TE5632]